MTAPRNTNFEDVGDFHEKFGLHNVHPAMVVAGQRTGLVGAGPQPPNDALMQFRIKFLFEELQELLEGVGYSFEDKSLFEIFDESDEVSFTHPVDHPQAADALVDLVYVALGTAHVLGYPFDHLWADVQIANMSKERALKDGSNSSTGRDPEYDVIKPEGWKPPMTAEILRAHGFDV